jgi:hypothetical protein
MVMMDNRVYPWLAGRVPNGFWDVRENRIRYMDWLARECHFQQPEDWYEARKVQFKSNHGGGLLCTQYGDSVYVALQDYRPDFAWLPWKFHTAPKKFWSVPENRRRYMNWLSAELGFRRVEDWYGVTKRSFKEHYGAGLLHGCYGDSALAAVQEYHPDHHWHAWLFKESPHRFWHDAANRRAYMTWLGQQLGYKRPEDWYGLTQRDFSEHKGAGLLAQRYSDSPQSAVREYLPELPRTPWLFTSVPQQFWHDAENRMCYLQWLGQRLGFLSSSDWFRLGSTDFKDNRGGGLLEFYANHTIGKAIGEARREAGVRNVIVWPVIQLIEWSSTDRDPRTLFQALSL